MEVARVCVSWSHCRPAHGPAVAAKRYVFGGLHTWGWITIILGVIQFTAAFSLFAGNVYGRVIGIFAATIGAIEALANVGGPHPWWSLGIFAVCLWVIHGIWC